MKKQTTFFFSILKTGILCALFILFSFIVAKAQWINDTNLNTAIVGENKANENKSISDGNGGIISVWVHRLYESEVVKVKKVSADGVTVWGEEFGIDISAGNTYTNYHDVITDGNGGAIIFWASANDVRIQRIDKNGNLMWGENGVSITYPGKSIFVFSPSIVTDGNGGAIILWTETINSLNLTHPRMFYGQRINAPGQKLWGDNGISMSTPLNYSRVIANYIFNDNNGNYTVVWADKIEESINQQPNSLVDAYYMQKINLNGEMQLPNKVKLFTLPMGYKLENIISDGNGGLFSNISLTNYDLNNISIYLQKHTSAGLPVIAGEYGILVDNNIANTNQVISTNYTNTCLISDNIGGAIVGWVDKRESNILFFVQRFSSSGSKLWNNNDVSIFGNNNTHITIKPATPITDKDGNFVYITTKGDYGDVNLIAQKININGQILWPINGVLVSNSQTNKNNFELINSDNKIIAIWQNYRYDAPIDISAQPIYNNGTTLPVSLTTFTALYGDNKVRLNWQTASENKNLGFEIERSSDGINFTKIDYVKGNGTTSVPQNYSHNDAKPIIQRQTIYYRLKQIDTDGGFEYSKIISVKIPQLNNVNFSVYPNPITSKQFNVNLAGLPKANYQLSISNMAGLRVKTTIIAYDGGLLSKMIDANLPVGVYILEITAPNFHQTKKLLIE